MSSTEMTAWRVTPQANFFETEEDLSECVGVEMTTECPKGLCFHEWRSSAPVTAQKSLGLYVTPQELFFTPHEPLWFGELGAECSGGMLN